MKDSQFKDLIAFLLLLAATFHTDKFMLYGLLIGSAFIYFSLPRGVVNTYNRIRKIVKRFHYKYSIWKIDFKLKYFSKKK